MNPQDAQRRPMTADEAREWLNGPDAQAARAAAEARKRVEQQERGRQWLEAWNALNDHVKQYNEEHAND